MRLENRIPPPIIALIMAAAMWAGSSLPPVVTSGGPRWVLAALLSGVGLAISASGVLQFRAKGTTIDPMHPERATALVVGGIYRCTRNPMYLGFATMLLAWATALGSVWSLAGPLLFVWFIGRYQIGPEERALRARFGDDFDRYTSRVRRWL